MRRTATALPVATAALALLAVACSIGPIGDIPPSICVKTVVSDVNVPTQTAADVLIVVDNSGSMAEEQQNLVDNFLNQDPAECPLQDLTNIPVEYKNPARAVYTGAGALAQCGMIQLIAAFDNDFQVGVITTDVGVCDNRIATAGPPGWGNRPQRGCLKPDGPPGVGLRKVIARADLLDGDATNDDFAARFRDTLANIGTVGSPFERGLDAVNLFLDPETDRPTECTDDLGLFRRPDADLVVIFLTDEEDCSHGIADGLATFGNENEDEVCGEFRDHYEGRPLASDCYAEFDSLPPVTAYADVLLDREPRLKVAVIAGAVGDDDTPSGCIVGGDGAPDDTCFPSGGLSNYNGTNEFCGPENAPARDNLPCCVADPGSRYYAFADAVGNKETDSICNASFRETMLDIAAFITAVDSVLLAEPPDNLRAMLVVLKKADGTERVLPLLDAATADCANETGFIIEDERRVRFCGEARPGPGDELAVRARAPAAQQSCDDPFYEASGGGVNCAAGPGSAVFALLALLPLLETARRRRSAARR